MKTTMRIGRKLFNLAAAVSLVCCVLTVGMWVWSWREQDSLYLPLRNESGLILSSSEGSLLCFIGFRASGGDSFFLRSTHVFESLAAAFWKSDVRALEGKWELHSRRVLGAGYYYFSAKQTTEIISRLVEIPFWMFAVASSMLPTVWTIHRVLLHRKLKTGLCTACGYDLRATPDRCPECGKEVAGKAASGAA